MAERVQTPNVQALIEVSTPALRAPSGEMKTGSDAARFPWFFELP
jgi:hypothetical protein